MITPINLLHASPTPRTRLGRQLQHRFTRLLLCRLERRIGPVLVLLACFALVPLDMMHHAMRLLARLAPEFRHVAGMNLA